MLPGEVYAGLVPILRREKHLVTYNSTFFFFLSDTAKYEFPSAALSEI